MDWLQRFYYKIWTRFGDKPFTDRWRDLWVKYEYFPMSIFFFCGVGIGNKFGWFWAGVIWIAYTAGYFMGHAHWGDKFLYKRIDDDEATP